VSFDKLNIDKDILNRIDVCREKISEILKNETAEEIVEPCKKHEDALKWAKQEILTLGESTWSEKMKIETAEQFLRLMGKS
jgi:flavodoxin